jgi:hypothetical protein
MVYTEKDIDFNITKKLKADISLKIFVLKQRETFHFFEKVKLHTLETINSYATECGFERIKIWGDYQLRI